MPKPPQLHRDAQVLSTIREYLCTLDSVGPSEEATTRLAAITSPLPLTHMELWERALREVLLQDDNVRSSRRFIFFGCRPARPLGWLDLCHGDGRRREAALRTPPAGVPNGFMLLLALRRLNDWVAEVRGAARERLPFIAEHADTAQWVDALWHALTHSTSWGRMETADKEILMNLVSVESVAEAFKIRIVSAASGPAAHLLSQIGRSSRFDRWLGEIARHAVQPSVRARAYRSLVEQRTQWIEGRRWLWTDLQWCKGHFEWIRGERPLATDLHGIDALARASLDKSPTVRRMAADLLVRHWQSFGPQCAALAERFAADPFASIAQRGQYVAGKLGDG